MHVVAALTLADANVGADANADVVLLLVLVPALICTGTARLGGTTALASTRLFASSGSAS